MRKSGDAGLNCVFVRASRGGSAVYPSEVVPQEPWSAGGADELKSAVDAAHKYGLGIHGWRVSFHLGSAPAAFAERMAKEDRLVRDPRGVQGRYLNPADPRNTEHEVQAVLELSRKYDLDGVHLDYVRYPDEPHAEWDYGPVSRREFERTSGRPVERWPQDVISGSRKLEYEGWERGAINRLAERIYTEVKKQKGHLLISAAVWQDHRRQRAALKQDWPLWVERGWLDFVAPMDYTPEHDTLASSVEAQVSAARGRVPVVAGIGSYRLGSPLDVVRQVEAAREHGADGFALSP